MKIELKSSLNDLNKDAASTTIITKPAKTDYPINELIARRWSARAFSTRAVEEDRKRLLEGVKIIKENCQF